MAQSSTDSNSARADSGLRRAVMVLASVALIALILSVLSSVIEVLLLFFISILIALMLTTLSRWLSRYTSLPRKVALGVVLIVIIALIALGLTLLAPGVVDQVRELAGALRDSLERLQATISDSELGQTLLDEMPDVQDMLPNSGDLLIGVTGVFSSLLSAFGTAVIVLFVAVYLALEPDLYVNGFLRLVPYQRRDRMREVLAQVARTLRFWLLSRAIAMLSVGTMATIGLTLIGIPLALPLGIVAGLFELIPNIGPILGAIPALLIAFPTGINEMLYVALLFFIIQQIESYAITPLIERKAVHLPPALTVVVQVMLGVTIGLIGVVLAAPLTAAGMVLVKMLYVEDILGESTDAQES